MGACGSDWGSTDIDGHPWMSVLMYGHLWRSIDIWIFSYMGQYVCTPRTSLTNLAETKL